MLLADFEWKDERVSAGWSAGEQGIQFPLSAAMSPVHFFHVEESQATVHVLSTPGAGAEGRTEGTGDRMKYSQHSGAWNLLTGSPRARTGQQMGFVGPAGIFFF